VVPVAVMTLFSELDQNWLQQSSNVYRVCYKEPEEQVTVVNVKQLQSVIAMVPDIEDGDHRWYAFYKPRFAMSHVVDGILPDDDE
jgi:hypothetical protein